ncbi:MAG: hypothetical protein J2P17_18775 [Mycobacterium sp.]|nr:hypothetical protein [Mycobacterium sp.]
MEYRFGGSFRSDVAAAPGASLTANVVLIPNPTTINATGDTASATDSGLAG